MGNVLPIRRTVAEHRAAFLGVEAEHRARIAEINRRRLLLGAAVAIVLALPVLLALVVGLAR